MNMEMQLRGRLTASIVLAAMLVALSTAAVSHGDDIGTAASNSTCRPGKLAPNLKAKCWLSIFEVPICVFEIVAVYEGGSVFTLTRSCCRAIIDLTENCKIEIFENSKLFPAIETFCTGIGGGGSGLQSLPPR